jgi:hypothetical protein
MAIHKSNRQLMDTRPRSKDGTLILHSLEHYVEIMADAFASALEDGFEVEEILESIHQKLQEWGVDHD